LVSPANVRDQRAASKDLPLQKGVAAAPLHHRCYAAAEFVVDTDEQIEAVEILKACVPLLQHIHDEAEARHDSYNSDTYMDSGEYELMEETSSLIARASTIIQRFKSA